MSDQIPTAEEQIPDIESIFHELEGRPAEEQVPVLAAILQAVLGQMQDIDGRVEKLCSDHADLDSKFHDQYYNILQDGWKNRVRGMGIDSIKQKYGSKFDPITEPLAGFGIDDVYGKLYDYLEELKQGEGWSDDKEGPLIDEQYQMAMDRIGKVRGKAPEPEKIAAPEPDAEEPPKQEPAKEPPKSLKEKKQSMRGLY